jgi:Xaa-Pro aminopeptidase
MKRTFALAVLLATFGLSLPLRSASDTAFYAARRASLMKRIGGGVAVLQGAAETRNYDRFRQSNDFYYLTGVETPGAMLLLDAARSRSVLFLPPRNIQTEVWEGPKLYPGDEARAATGFDEVLDVSKFAGELQQACVGGKDVYTPFRPEETAMVSRDRAMQSDAAQERGAWDGRLSREKAFQAKLHEKVAQSSVKDLSPVLDRMRRVKDEQEIQRLREAGRIGALGIAEAIRATEPGLYEYQVAAVAEFIFKWHGAMGPGYFAIVGSGPNGCVLHYSANSRKMEAGELVVMDFGPDYAYYQADITRTFPVSGKFTEEQTRVFKTVLEAQREAIAAVRPGATFGDLNRAARRVIDSRGYSEYWRHGVSHYVGMSVHDVGDMEPFEPGVVVTVEPGIYMPKKSLGIRIEDTLLVTPTGSENLTSQVPTSPEPLMGTDLDKLSKFLNLREK